MKASHDRILVILQRDNFVRDKGFIEALAKKLEPAFGSIHYFETRGSYAPLVSHTSAFLDSSVNSAKFANLSSWRRKLYKAFLLLKYPSRWSYYFIWHRSTEVSIDERARRLAAYVESLKKGNCKVNGEPDNMSGGHGEVIVLARSSGGRVASLVADEAGIQKLICLSYPFRHPERGMEPERYSHLKHIKTPFLIFQGSRDEYGGSEVVGKYALSPAVSVEIVDTDHDFEISPETLDEIARKIIAFSKESGRESF